NLSPEKNANENGMSMQNDNFEEIINLPIGSKPSRLDAMNNDGSNSPEIPLNPILAFEDKGTLLPQVDNVQNTPNSRSDLIVSYEEPKVIMSISAVSGVSSML
ncbi:PREDICTED: ensconsin-like, partial [Pterocles gutturalis]|uniref:ensconsin-like n=1 Tax=Pterocles gutturalis TaxID=240206 RepID=UPI0005293CDC